MKNNILLSFFIILVLNIVGIANAQSYSKSVYEYSDSSCGTVISVTKYCSDVSSSISCRTDCDEISGDCAHWSSSSKSCSYGCNAAIGECNPPPSCTPNWSCAGWSTCTTTDTSCSNTPSGTQTCTGGWTDSNKCSQTYTGGNTQSCSITRNTNGNSCTSGSLSGTCQEGICVIPSSAIGPQSTCWLPNPPSDPFSLSNGCTGTITSLAWDEDTTGDMTYQSSLDARPAIFIRTTTSDDPANGCNNANVVFDTIYSDNTSNPPLLGSKIDVKADLTQRCGTDDHFYGYKILTSNCKILDMVQSCTGVCPTDPKRTAETFSSDDTSRTMRQRVPDISGILSNCNPQSDADERYFAYTFTIGECRSNSDCPSTKPVCDTTTNMCNSSTTPPPTTCENTCSNAEYMGALSSIGDSRTKTTCSLDTTAANNDYWYWFAPGVEGIAIASVTGGSFGVTAYTGACNSLTTVDSASGNNPTMSFDANIDTYSLKVTRASGTGSADVRVKLGECLSNDLTYGDTNPNNDRSSACIAKDPNKPRCDISSTSPTAYQCVQPAACGINADCPTNQCCTADSTLPISSRAVAGECKPLGELRQPYLCTK